MNSNCTICRIRWMAALAGLTLAAGITGVAQQQPSMNPLQLVRDAAYNEVHSDNHGYRFTYRDKTQYKDHSITKEVIETRPIGISRTVAINGQPLTPDQRQKADDKMRKLIESPDAQRKKEQSDRADQERETLMLSSLPDAFLYTYVGKEQGPRGENLVHLKFTPNPKFDPPNHETQVYQGMQGDMLIDLRDKRIALMDGKLFKDVNFGWGVLGKLDRGGTFRIKQERIIDGSWETTEEALHMTGKILLVKPLTISSTETMTDFRQVPDHLTLSQAWNLLQKSNDVVAENGSGDKDTSQHK